MSLVRYDTAFPTWHTQSPTKQGVRNVANHSAARRHRNRSHDATINDNPNQACVSTAFDELLVYQSEPQPSSLLFLLALAVSAAERSEPVLAEWADAGASAAAFGTAALCTNG